MPSPVPIQPNTVAIIPARGGSKRIPRKNVREFHGVPLIARTIRTLLDTELFHDVVVSTDDDEIADVSRGAGATVPFKRTPELSDDHTPTSAVVVDAIERLQASNEAIGEVCVAYPAAVFVEPGDIKQAQSLLHQTSADVVFSAGAFVTPIERAWRPTEQGDAQRIWPEHALTRSQDLEPAYFDAGQIYWWASGVWRRVRDGAEVRRAMFVLPKWKVHDIDDEEDWISAELSFEAMRARR